MKSIEQQVIAFSIGNHHVFYTDNIPFKGIFIVFITFAAPTTWEQRRLSCAIWKAFLHKHPDPIYFSTLDPGYIGNHCKLYNKFGDNKVYEYVR